MPSHPLSILNRSDLNLDAVVKTLTHNLWDNPMTVWVFPLDCHDRQRWIEGFFYTITQSILSSGGVVDCPDNGDYVLICSLGNESEADEALLFRQLKESTGPCFKRVEQILKCTTAHYPDDLSKHIYIMFFCIAESKRGKGIFLDLFKRLTPLLAAEKIGIYAEASTYTNLRLWQRLGFRQVGQSVTLPDNGPVFFPMYWAP